jgi:Tfp pilus assembly protein PilF
MHQYPEAVEEYSQALQFDPANANIHNDLGVILYQLGKYEKAAEEFSDAIRIDPAHTNARKNLDIAEAKLNNKSANNGRK